ncbi:MAG: helix-turn-helix transcriptional regulator [Bacteroides sp.]|nr:helix-turn-helix transcriptional regulator [Bacteroides sp.]
MNYKEEFSKRLICLREQKGLTQQQLADELQITRQSLSLYEKAERTINIELLAKIADFFSVSTDYLMGRTDIKSMNEDIQAVCKVTGLSERAINTITAFQKYRIDPEIKEFWNNNIDDIIENDNFLSLYFFVANMYISSKKFVELVLNGADQKEIIDKETKYKVEVFQCTETFRKLIDNLRFPLYERANKYYYLTLLIGKDAERFKPSESDRIKLKQLFDEEVSKHGKHNPTQE